MDSLKLPTTAARAKVFMGEGSLSFPTSSAGNANNAEAVETSALNNNNNNINNGDHSTSDEPLKLEADTNISSTNIGSGITFNPKFNQDGSATAVNDPNAIVSANGTSNLDTQNPSSSVEGAVAGATDLESSASGIVPTLQNIVATVNLDCRLELKTIALHARNAEYNPKRFAAVIMRIREPKTTALIFASGKMVVTGAKSEDDSKLAARKYARIIQKLGFNAKFTDFKIQNIVGSCDVKFPIRLEGLAYAHGTFSSYEPELFPGLIYRMVKPKIVLLIFVSGKIVLTGAKQREEIYKAFEAIYPVLSEFRKN